MNHQVLKKIKNIANKYARHAPSGCYNSDDLTQEGYLAASSAHEDYNPSYGLKPEDWMVQKAKYAIQKYVSKNHCTIGNVPMRNNPIKVFPLNFGNKLEGDPLDDTNLLVEDLLKNCTEIEKEILRLRFWEQKELYDIAKIMGVSTQAISARLIKLLNRMKFHERNYN